MGTITANIGIYIPANGEEIYGTSFATGMQNIDQHDHSGGPNKGVPLSSASIGAGSITRDKLNNNVIAGNGLAFDGNHSIILTGSLPSISTLIGSGLIVQTVAGTALLRTLQQVTNQTVITNPAGTAGDPIIGLAANLNVSGVNPAVGNFTVALNGVTQIVVSPGLVDLSANQSAINSFHVVTPVIPVGVDIPLVTIGPGQAWLFSAVNSAVDNAFHAMYIVYSFAVGNLVFISLESSPVGTFPVNDISYQGTNVQFIPGTDPSKDIRIKNTSGAANRAFNVSGLRIL